MKTTTTALATLVVVAALALAGCATTPTPATTTASSTPDTLTGSLTISAAASLTGTFDALKKQFEAAHPNVTVTINYGGSSALATQITSGAPADVFAAANDSTMKTVTDAGLASAPATFATNVLELAVPAGNPGKVTGLSDLANPALTIVLCDTAVPCGSAAQALLTKAGVMAAPDSLEQDVKSVLTKLSLDEADAGLVYVTDVKAAGDKVEGIAVPEAASVVNNYPIVVLSGAKNPDAAAAWVAYVLSPAGRSVLQAAGFGAP